MNAVIVLIPAYEPGEALVELCRALVARPEVSGVLVIDDGSGTAYAEVFARAEREGAVVRRYLPNRGKGHALKVGFREAQERFPGHVVVCADSDGQHAVDDIVRVAGEVSAPDEMVLGGRRFTGEVPARSRIGNTVTAWLFRVVTGIRVRDTQTGLRAYPAAMLPWLRGVAGERFEYELSLLLEADAAGFRMREVPIETIYLHGNASSHFRPVRDSWRVYRPLLAFGAASLAGFAVDAALLFVVMAATGDLLFSAVAARLVSASVNYSLNRHVTFGRGTPTSPLRYAAVAVGVFAANYALLAALVTMLPLLAAKVATEGLLLGASFLAQRRFVFWERATRAAGEAPVGAVGLRPSLAAPPR